MNANYKEYKFSDLIEEVEERNTSLEYGLDDIVGVTIEKGLIPTIANLTQTALDKFYIVKPDTFVYNPRTHGVRLGMGYNDTNKTFLTSWNNVAFRVKEDAKKIVLSKYLWIYFNRPEWDRQTNFMAWGSSTIVFAWNDFLSIKIKLPDLKEQEKIVNTYNAITKRIQLKQKINENLEKTAQCIFEKLNKDKSSNEKLGNIAEINSGKRPDDISEGLIPLVGAGDVMGYVNNYNYDGKTLVIGRVGTHGKVQRFNDKCWCSDNTLTIKSNFFEYTYFILKNIDYSLLNRGSTQPLITQTDMKEFEIYFNREEILNFENSVSKIMHKYDENKVEIAKLQELKQLVISSISGE